LTEHTYCDRHDQGRQRGKSRRRRESGDPSMSIYSTPRWRRVRARMLRLNPRCTCGRRSRVVDHVIPREQLVARGVEDPDDEAWLQALCKPCHDRKTATIDGGFGRPALDIEAR
jgi:5-methylcytosine-specific restriction enzyme A